MSDLDSLAPTRKRRSEAINAESDLSSSQPTLKKCCETEALCVTISDLELVAPTPYSIAANTPTWSGHNSALVIREDDSGSPTAPVEELELEEQVCFGALLDIITKVLVVERPDSLQFRQVEMASNNLIKLSLNIGENSGDICCDEGVILAHISTKMHLALSRLSLYQPGTEFQALVNEEELLETIQIASTAHHKDVPTTCCMELLVSGPRQMADQVAKTLAQFHLFLQQPLPHTTLLPYENPQYLELPGITDSDLQPSPQPSGPIQTAEVDKITPEDAVQVGRRSQIELQKVIDEVPVPVGLKAAEIDRRIKTKLLSHQKEGVEFVIQRERGLHFGSGLWTSVSTPSPEGHSGFRHRITGEIRAQPDGFLGGLLADDMGLGKTLTMISSIVSTLDSARQHVNGQSSSALRLVSTTLVLVPSVCEFLGPVKFLSKKLTPREALIDTWISQIERHVLPGTLSIYRYHGDRRQLSTSSPLPYDVVFSTYATVASDSSRGGGVLCRFQWYRLILDEVNDLAASVRWCLTGTPIQNTVEDLGSLIKFLRVPSLSDSVSFRKHIGGVPRGGYGFATPNIPNLKCLLEAICLRRGKSVLSLLATEHTHDISFSVAEERTYLGLVEVCKRSIAAAISGHRETQAYKTVLSGLLRQRMFCNVGVDACRDDSKAGDNGSSESDRIIGLLQQGGEATCINCYADVLALDEPDSPGSIKPRLTHCHQLICEVCVAELPKWQEEEKCPACKKTVGGDIFLDLSRRADSSSRDSVSAFPKGRRTGWPSKLLVLVKDIENFLASDKSIVFSFWRQSLDVLGQLLAERGISFLRVDGMLKPKQRGEILQEFRLSGSARVLLMTLGTGSVGLNDLDVASRLHFMEPQWNPAVEHQAIGRLLRLGQKKQVCIVRYVVKKSIEEKVRKQQITKIRLASAGGLHSAPGNGDLRAEQLKALQKAMSDW